MNQRVLPIRRGLWAATHSPLWASIVTFDVFIRLRVGLRASSLTPLYILRAICRVFGQWQLGRWAGTESAIDCSWNEF